MANHATLHDHAPGVDISDDVDEPHHNTTGMERDIHTEDVLPITITFKEPDLDKSGPLIGLHGVEGIMNTLHLVEGNITIGKTPCMSHLHEGAIVCSESLNGHPAPNEKVEHGRSVVTGASVSPVVPPIAPVRAKPGRDKKTSDTAEPHLFENTNRAESVHRHKGLVLSKDAALSSTEPVNEGHTETEENVVDLTNLNHVAVCSKEHDGMDEDKKCPPNVSP